MLSYGREKNLVAVHNRLNNNISSDIFVVGDGMMTTGTRNTNTLTRSRSSNEEELRHIDNNNANIFIKNNVSEGQRKYPRRSSLTSPQHQMRRNCLVRSYNNLNRNEQVLHGSKVGKPNLKRVSFGSSKGSMVETLIYDHQDEDVSNAYHPPYYHHQHHIQHHHYPSRRNGYYRANILTNGHPNKNSLRVSTPEEVTSSKSEISEELKPAKVKVTFLESRKPDVILSPEYPYLSNNNCPLDLNVPLKMSTTPEELPELQHANMDSGNENPFRPDGELSKEADSIVEMIKEGKPITPTKGDNVTENGITQPDGMEVDEDVISPVQANSVESSKPGTNGTTPQTITVEPGSVDIQHSVVSPPGEADQVEHVNIKKKPKCKCCVIQ